MNQKGRRRNWTKGSNSRREVKQNSTITTVGLGEIQKVTEEKDLDVNMYKGYINPASETIRGTTAATRKNCDGKKGRKRANEVAVCVNARALHIYGGRASEWNKLTELK